MKKHFMSIFIIAIITTLSIFLWKTRRTHSILEGFANNAGLINQLCDHYSIDPRLYVSVVYGELYNNLDDLDRTDILRAAAGFNPSIGFAQIRLSTAKWIEIEHCDELEIKPSKNRYDLIERIARDSMNICYSICYIRLIQKSFQETTGALPNVQQTGSWYARGIDREDVVLSSEYQNIVGRTANQFYQSEALTNHYPRESFSVNLQAP